MWSHLMSEASVQQNFNFGFSTNKSEILIHLSQWQYWWWFWFSLLWTLYFYIIIRVFSKRTFNLNIVLNTSSKSRGKWGDFLIAIIPVSWCCNILINSNFILRLIEWQNESSLFTIRIQGKQWYWVYKYDPNTSINLQLVPKNIGHNNWRVSTMSNSYNADTYYQAINLGTQLEFDEIYKNNLNENSLKTKLNHPVNLQSEKLIFFEKPKKSNSFVSDSGLTKTYKNYAPKHKISDLTIDEMLEYFFYKYIYFNTRSLSLTVTDFFYDHNVTQLDYFKYFQTKNLYNIQDKILYTTEKISKINIKNLNYIFSNPKIRSKIENTFSKIVYDTRSFDYDYLILNHHKIIFRKLISSSNFYDFLQFDETEDTTSNLRHLNITTPFRLIRGYLNNHVLDSLQNNNNLNKLLFFNTLFNKSGNTISDKDSQSESFWGFRQKKLDKFDKYEFKPQIIYDPFTLEAIGTNKNYINNEISHVATDHYIDNSQNLEIFNKDTCNNKLNVKTRIISFNSYTQKYEASLKHNRYRSELIPVTLSRRLLQTKRTLILPIHINLTLITNSYDVVHSWFIPSLGLKLDCVPGRSTHHTLYIENIGFYYGQCAEICGRYHHHMPIRVCAITFEQFCVWWNAKGLKRIHRLNNIKVISNQKPFTSDKLKFRI